MAQPDRRGEYIPNPYCDPPAARRARYIQVAEALRLAARPMTGSELALAVGGPGCVADNPALAPTWWRVLAAADSLTARRLARRQAGAYSWRGKGKRRAW